MIQDAASPSGERQLFSLIQLPGGSRSSNSARLK
jgi:hypothetical protein